MYAAELQQRPAPQEHTAGPTVFVSNVERALSEDGRVVAGYAQKVGEISTRAVWYKEYDTVVLPTEPDNAFIDYAASLGRSPKVVVPAGVQEDSLSIRDGFADPNFRAAVTGRWSESYINDTALHAFVTAQGGRYAGGDPGNTVERVNDKANFAHFAEGLVPPPPGVLARTVHGIAETVHRQLHKHGTVYVRHTFAGGGLGNRRFQVNGHVPNVAEIVPQLQGDQPHLWEEGTALVEQFVHLVGSPSVALRAGHGAQYSTYQITHNQDYRGFWSPLPPEIWDPEGIQAVGDGISERLARIGFWNWAGVDLGVGPQGERYGFEINGRTVGTRHGIAVGELLLGPWKQWRQDGTVVKSVDHFELKAAATFPELHERLRRLGHLASPDNPYGAVITIPPKGNVAGIQVHGKGYRQTEERYQEIVAAVGKPSAHSEDHPLLKNPLMRSR